MTVEDATLSGASMLDLDRNLEADMESDISEWDPWFWAPTDD